MGPDCEMWWERMREHATRASDTFIDRDHDPVQDSWVTPGIPDKLPGRTPLGEPARVGKYQIVRKIGDGGMATIYLATSAGPDGFSKRWALKVIRPEFSENSEITSTLVQEAKVAGLLTHPNIVQVSDFGRWSNGYYLTMEWVDGVPLSQLLSHLVRSRKAMGINICAYIALAIAEALAYLKEGVSLQDEQRSLVHRDVTPSNVLISTSGSVKLTDFGIVKVLESPSVTNVGVVKGKYAYMSPEQLRGDPVDHRSDIFAFGVLFYEILTRTRLFRRKTLAATIAAVHAARVLPPSAINDDVPIELDRVVLRALSKNPSERFADAGEIVDLLRPFAAQARRSELLDLVRAAMTNVATEKPAAPTIEQRLVPAPPVRAPSPPPEIDASDPAEAGDSRDFEALASVDGEPSLMEIDEEPDWTEPAIQASTPLPLRVVGAPAAEVETPLVEIPMAPHHDATDSSANASRDLMMAEFPERSARWIEWMAIGVSILATVALWSWVLRR
jgi:eukaryotic-like serine/threonine-protein kinase